MLLLTMLIVLNVLELPDLFDTHIDKAAENSFLHCSFMTC